MVAAVAVEHNLQVELEEAAIQGHLDKEDKGYHVVAVMVEQVVAVGTAAAAPILMGAVTTTVAVAVDLAM